LIEQRIEILSSFIAEAALELDSTHKLGALHIALSHGEPSQGKEDQYPIEEILKIFMSPIELHGRVTAVLGQRRW